MNKITDQAFGEMHYNYSWETKVGLNIWDQMYSIKIVANDPDEAGITSKQRESYNEIKTNISNIITQHEDNIRDYCNTVFDVKMPDMQSVILPKSIVFQRDGSWGILFDCAYDPEHGLAIYFVKGKTFVGSQDDFL
ncbi:DUF6985 domain-containing protein [Maridesulfovibrio sp.]|uniref:DUF6985 domain-containing protein n=1 Tax=Maridesulfovibrio sp. TaxID=2795000 RepID=UPI0029CA7A8E|nr:hypothetical protein [Maridesulfovibrio sp.]